MIRQGAKPDEDVARPEPKWLFAILDTLITTLLWVYFTAGFVIFFGPFYLLAVLLAKDSHLVVQKLNHFFYRGFFALCRLLMPRQRWRIDPKLAAVRSSVILCNHISYIDSILMIALCKRHTTVVKNRLFKIPILGWVLRQSGYLPAATEGRLAEMMGRRLEALPGFLASGGNLIVFPEGTRSRTGAVGTLNAGAFKIARLCRAPLTVVRIRNTNRLFMPGKFLFNACGANTNTLDLVAQFMPDYDSEDFSLTGLKAQVGDLLAG